MRILISVPSLDRRFGGPAAKGRFLAGELRRLGNEVHLVGCGESGEGATGLGRIGNFHSTPIPSSIRPLIALTRVVDVVHVIGYRDPVGSVAAMCALSRGLPLLIEPVGMLGPKLRSARLKRLYEQVVGRRLLRSATLVATSSIEADEIRAVGVSPDRVVTRPNGIDVSELLPLPKRGSFRRWLEIPPQAILILSLSRLVMTKGLSILPEAASHLPNVYFVLAGPDERDGTPQRIRHLIDRYQLGRRVFLLPGGLWGRDKARALVDADMFCLPSLTESFGIAALEAAAIGIPVVMSDRCGGKEWLPSDSSRIFRAGSARDLVAAIQDLETCSLRSAATRSAMHVRESLSWKRVALSQQSIYLNLLQR